MGVMRASVFEIAARLPLERYDENNRGARHPATQRDACDAAADVSRAFCIFVVCKIARTHFELAL